MKKLILVSVLVAFMTGCLPQIQFLTAPVPKVGVQIEVTAQAYVEAKATPSCPKRGIMEKLIKLLNDLGLREFGKYGGIDVFSQQRGYITVMLALSRLPSGSTLLTDVGAPSLKALHEALEWGSIEFQRGDRSKGDIRSMYVIENDIDKLRKDCE